jgi:CheY-like chemotaxis protein
MEQRNSTVEILLVEDNPADVRLTTEAMRECGFATRVHVAENGVEAMRFLRRQGEFAAAPVPDLVLLDLNLPVKNGREVLSEIKADAALRRIPVIVFSTSSSPEDIERSYDLHANCYICKPSGFDGYLDVIAEIERFWCGTVCLPGHGGEAGGLPAG